MRQSTGTVTAAKRDTRKTEITANVVQKVQASGLSPDDKAAVIAAIESTPTELDDATQNRSILETLMLTLKERGVDPNLLRELSVASAKVLAGISKDVRPGGTDGVAEVDDPEIAFVLESLRQSGVSQSLILGSLLNNLDPETLNTPDKLKSVMNSAALENFGSAAKAAAFQDKLVAAAAKNDQPVLTSPGETVVAPDASTPYSPGPINVDLATASDTEAQIFGHGLSYVIVRSPAIGQLGSFPSNAVVGGEVSYTPDSSGPRAAYTEIFSYKICDSVTPPACTDPVIVTVNVPEVTAPVSPTVAENQRPSIAVAGETSKATPQNTPVTVSLSTGSDPDTISISQSLSYLVSAQPSNGTLSGWAADATVGGSVTYIPNNGYWGVDSFSYQICDSHSTPLCSSATTVSLSVLFVNNAPTDLSLSSSSIAENSGANAVVGALSATDPDTGSSFTYTLVAGAGDTDNGSFNINAGNLRLGVDADFESKNSYAVRLRATDAGGLFVDKTFVVTVTNVNETPTDIALSSSSIAENSGANAVVGALSATDPDTGSSFIYTLVAGAGDTDNGSFNINAGNLRLGVDADFESKNSYAVRLRATDAGGLFFDKALVVSVTDVGDWYPEAYIKAANAEAGDRFGGSVSLSGDTIAVGADREDENSAVIVNGATAPNDNGAAESGAVYVYRRAGAAWAREAYIKAANAQAGDNFGISVSLSGDTLAVGGAQEDENSNVIVNGTTAPNNDGLDSSGAVYIYRRTVATWSPEAFIKAANVGAYDWFGYSVSLSGDTLAVGAFSEDENSSVIVNGSAPPNADGADSSGAVYVYRRTGGTWAQEAYVKAANPQASDLFGWSVSLDGDTLAVGSRGEDEESTAIVNGSTAPNANGADDSGAIYVYRRTGVTWAREAYIKAANAQAGDEFGFPFSVSGDTLAVGARQEDENSAVIVNGTTAPNANGANDSGAVYVYRRTGTAWAQEAYVKAANVGEGDLFGWSVSLGGNTLAVGASGEDENSTVIVNGTTAPNANGASNSGAVYVYRRNGAAWAPEAYIKAANAGAADSFGLSVSLSGDTLAVGARQEDANSTTIVNGPTAPNTNGADDSGAVYVYRNSARLFDPHVYVSATTSASVTLTWGAIWAQAPPGSWWL
jgi:hypothetical protein